MKNSAGVEVVSLVSDGIKATRAAADKYDTPHATTMQAETVALKHVDAVILATPPPMHAAHA